MLGFFRIWVVWFGFLRLCLFYFLISSHYDGLHFFSSQCDTLHSFSFQDVVLFPLFLILFADDDGQIIFTLYLKWKGNLDSITMLEDVIDDYEEDFDNSIFFLTGSM